MPKKPLLQDLTFLAIAALLVLAFGRIYAGFVQDDAYITFRYARNIAAGQGFVYNPGEYVLGTSTPLYALTLALFARLTSLPIPDVAHALNLAALWAAAIAIYKLGRPRGFTFSAVTALLTLTNPFLRHMVGMETPVLLTLLLLAVWAYTRERLWITSILLGALVLVRYEMAFFAALLASADWYRHRRLPLWPLPALGIVGAWLLYAALTFGSPIPLSATAKLVSARVPFLVGLLAHGVEYTRQVGWFPLHAYLLLVGVAVLLIRRDVHLAYGLPLVWSLVYLLLAAFTAGSFPWYYGPLLPGIAIATVWGAGYVSSLPSLVMKPNGAPERGKTISRGLFLLLSLALLLTNLTFWARDWRAYGGGTFDPRIQPYAQVSAWLTEHAAPGDTLAAGEIGYLGYITDVRIVDFYGLVTPGLLPWVAHGLEVSAPKAIDFFAPDYVLVSAETMPVESYGLDDRYSLAARFNGGYLIYARGPEK